MTFGIILLIIGIVFLLKNLGIIAADIWSVLWPSLLIVVGLRIICKRKHWNCGIWHKK